MRRVISMLLAVLLVGGIFFAPVTLTVMQNRHRHRMAKKAARRDYRGPHTTLAFDLSEQIFWQQAQIIDHGKEIRFRGEMYDIVEVCKEGTRLEIVCFPDPKEDAILRALAAAARHNGDNRVQGKTVSFAPLQLIPTTHSTLIPSNNMGLTTLNSFSRRLEVQFWPEPLPHPPKMAA